MTARRHRFGLRVYERRALIDQLFAIRQTAASIATDTGWACSAATTRPFLPTDVDRSAFFIALVVVDVLAGLANFDLRPLRRAVSRRSGAPRPASAERRPHGKSARRNRLRHGFWSVGRPEDERLRRCSWLSPGSSVGYALLAFTKDFAVLLVIAAIPLAVGGSRLLPIDCARQTAFRPRQPLHRQSHHRRPSRQLVARVGHRTCNRGGGRRGVRVSRRVRHKRRFRRWSRS